MAGHYLKAVFLVVGAAVAAPQGAEKKNACSSFADYFVIDQSQNCWYDPDLDADIFEIIGRRNISMEIHSVETADGYILTSFRLLREEPKGVVYLVHPYTQTSMIWFNDEHSALGFVLYYAGYEVWLSNNRGTYYSSGHRNLSAYDYQYWNFTFHEMGVYDIPTELDMIKNVTQKSDIILVGFSLSATSAVVYASLFPEHAKSSVKLFVLLAPVIYSNFFFLENPLVDAGYDRFMSVFDRLKVGTFGLSFSATRSLFKLVCEGRFLKFLCFLPLEGVSGLKNFDATKVSFNNRHFLTRIPSKILRHYYQIHKSSRFQQFDYERPGNLLVYNSTRPPLYPIENIDIPVYIIHGGQDKAATAAKVERFYGELSPAAKVYGKLLVPEFGHLDFAFGKQYKEYISDAVMRIVDKVQ